MHPAQDGKMHNMQGDVLPGPDLEPRVRHVQGAGRFLVGLRLRYFHSL